MASEGQASVWSNTSAQGQHFFPACGVMGQRARKLKPLLSAQGQVWTRPVAITSVLPPHLSKEMVSGLETELAAVPKPRGVVRGDWCGRQLHGLQWDALPIQGLSRYGEIGSGAGRHLCFNPAP